MSWQSHTSAAQEWSWGCAHGQMPMLGEVESWAANRLADRRKEVANAAPALTQEHTCLAEYFAGSSLFIVHHSGLIDVLERETGGVMGENCLLALLAEPGDSTLLKSKQR